MEPPPNEYLRSLGALLSTDSPSQRLKHTEALISVLSSTNTKQAPLIASLTSQAISQLFTNDHLKTPTEKWSTHPSHTEPLLQSLLTLLSNTFHQSPPSNPLPSPSTTLHPSSLSIYPPPRPDLTPLADAFEDATNNLVLAVAHLLHLLGTLSTEQSTDIACLSYHTLASLTRLLPADTRAAFLPGLVSSLSRSLVHATDLHSTLCISALDALHVVLSTLNLPPSNAVDASQRPPVCRPTSGKPRLSVTRDAQWIESASKQAAPRIIHFLTTATGPLHHGSPRAREYLTTFIFALLQSTVLSEQCSQILRFTLFALAGDDFPSVRFLALHYITQLVNRRNVTLHHIQSGIRAIVSARGFTSLPWHSGENISKLGTDAGNALKRLSGTSDYVWTRVATGYLNAMVPPQRPNMLTVVPSKTLTSSIAVIGPDAFCHMLTELLAEQWTVTEDSAEGFATALQCLVLRAAESLGHGGLLTSIFSTFVKRAQIHDFDDSGEAHLRQFRERGYAVLLLQAVLTGEIRRDEVITSEVHQRLVYECTKETLQLVNCFFIPSTDMLSSESVDDAMISLKHCLLVCTARLFEELADLHHKAKIRPLGADITLVMLMSLLRDISHGEVSVRSTAKVTIGRISKAIGWKNERRLLLRHLNYIIGRVIRNLEKKWAGDVLRFVIGKKGDDVSREATVLLESTFQRMNESLAGAGDETALITMNSIINVLSTAVAQKQEQERDSDVQKKHYLTGKAIEEIMYQNDLSELRKSVFAFCTEDIPNYEELTARVELVNKSFLEDAGSDDESNRSAFETIATHALEGTRDILVGRPWNVCAASLLCATLSVKLLEGRRRILLPFAAKILPLLPDQFVVLNEEITSGERILRDFRRRKFGDLGSGDNVEDLVLFLNNKGRQLPVVTNACLLLAAFAEYAGSFIRDRFVRLIYPKLRPLLRLAQCFPTLLVPAYSIQSTRVTTPSYGAMSACDACLEAIASVAKVAPDVLAPFASSLVKYIAVFFDRKFDPATSPKRQVVHTNRSMVRFECERWMKRCEFAETVVRQLKIVNASDVLMTLVKCDDTAPKEIKPLRGSLHAISVRRSASKVQSSGLK